MQTRVVGERSARKVRLKSTGLEAAKPVHQGKIAGHTRKFDSRLAIELLRAHMPNTFRTPGAKVNISTGNQCRAAFRRRYEPWSVFRLR
jgi:hypothetical protein